MDCGKSSVSNTDKKIMGSLTVGILRQSRVLVGQSSQGERVMGHVARMKTMENAHIIKFGKTEIRNCRNRRYY